MYFELLKKTNAVMSVRMLPLLLLLLVWKGRGNGLTITANDSRLNYAIFNDGNVAERVRVGRVETRQCQRVPRLPLWPQTDFFDLHISGSSSPSSLHVQIQRNTNGLVVQPNVTRLPDPKDGAGFVPTTVHYRLNFSCLPANTSSALVPWAFVVIEVIDGSHSLEFELLKICDARAFEAFDWGAVLLLILTIGIIILATLSQVPVSLETKKEPHGRKDEPKTDVTVGLVLFFVAAASTMLILAFFYTTAFLIVFTITTCISGTFLIGVYLFQLIQMVTTMWPSLRAACLQKVVCKALTIAEAIAYGLSLSLFVSWVYTKHWVLNNLIGAFFVLCFLRVIRVKSLLISTLLLGLLFVYDIFWVFLSSSVFGSNVMETVATSLDLPIMLQMPRLNCTPSNQCMMIGLGDLVLPGVVIAFAHKASKRLHTQLYYVSCVVAYILALILCEIVLYVFRHSQPALLYISPALLLAFYIPAAYRKETQLLLKGLPSHTPANNSPQPTISQETGYEQCPRRSIGGTDN